MERLPKEAKDKDAFFFTPLKSFSMDKGKPWFSAVPVGRNTLDCLVKDASVQRSGSEQQIKSFAEGHS